MNLSGKFRFLLLLFCLVLGGIAYGSYTKTREADALRNALDTRGIRTTAKVVKVTWQKDQFGDGNPRAEITFATKDIPSVNGRVDISSDEKDILVSNPNLSMIDIRYLPDNLGQLQWVGDVTEPGFLWAPFLEGLAGIFCFIVAVFPARLARRRRESFPRTHQENFQPANDAQTALRRQAKRKRARIIFSALIVLGNTFCGCHPLAAK